MAGKRQADIWKVYIFFLNLQSDIAVLDSICCQTHMGFFLSLIFRMSVQLRLIKSISFLTYKGYLFCFAHLPLSPLVTYLESSKTSAVREMARKKSKADTNYRGVLAGRGLFWVEVLPCKNCWVEVFTRPPRTNMSIQHGSTLLNSTHHTCLATILNDVGWWWMTLNAVERSLFCHQSFDPTSFSIYFVLRCERQRWAR